MAVIWVPYHLDEHLPGLAVGIACTWYPGYGAVARLAPHLETVLA